MNNSKGQTYDSIGLEWLMHNSKGRTYNSIGLEWLMCVFDPNMRDKANGKQCALVCDGYGSHVQLKVLRFCIDNNISLLLMLPHSLYLCQPLDVGVFSPLKTYMSPELDKIIRYGISNIKKFEWADAYRNARPQAMAETNIKSAFRTAGLSPFNHHKVLVRMPDFKGNEINNVLAPPVNVDASSYPFTEIPTTPLRIDSSLLHRASVALITNIEAGIFDTPTHKFIPKLIAVAEYSSSQVVQSGSRKLAHHYENFTTR